MQSGLSKPRYIRGSVFVLLFISHTLSIFITHAANADNSYATLEWVDLIPQEDLDALLNPPDELENVVDVEGGDILNQLTALIDDGTGTAGNRYLQALVSTNVRAEYDKRRVRIPGYIVPLEFDDNQMVTEFFLVPYYGACIHLPPPPPNQIIYSTYSTGVSALMMYYAVWLEGTISTTLTNNELATASYAMAVDSLTLYDFEDE